MGLQGLGSSGLGLLSGFGDFRFRLYGFWGSRLLSFVVGGVMHPEPSRALQPPK